LNNHQNEAKALKGCNTDQKSRTAVEKLSSGSIFIYDSSNKEGAVKKE